MILILLYLISLYVIHRNCLHFIHTEHHNCDCNDEGCKCLVVKFYSGQNITTVNITISDDTEIECNETVRVHIPFDRRIELLTDGVIITIVDDDIGKSLTLYAFYNNKMIIYMHKLP